jgi:uncharacterized protein YuzE
LVLRQLPVICDKERADCRYLQNEVVLEPTSPIRPDERIRESDEVRPGVLADFGHDGGVVRFEIMQASRVVQNAREIQFAAGE